MGALALADVLRGAADDRLGGRLLALALDLEGPLAFQLPVEPPFFRRGFFEYGRFRPLELEPVVFDPKSSSGSKPGDGGGGKYRLVMLSVGSSMG